MFCPEMEIVRTTIENKKSVLGSIANTIFTHPELNFKEYTAHQCLTDVLEKEGFMVERGYILDTAFRAVFSNTKDTDVTNVAVLCEYDALPDIGHACGHNLIAEVGIAAALGIKAVLEKCQDIKGKVTVLGCPAEEGGGGKIKLIQDGAFKDIDVAMMSHPSVANVAMPKLPAIKCLTVTYDGRASHACTAPWEGVNALDAAVIAYNSLSVLRQQCKPDWRISAVITEGGIESYIIPARAQMKVSYRALSLTDQTVLGEKVEKCLHAAATVSSCEIHIHHAEDSYMSMSHNQCMVKNYVHHCQTLGLEMCSDSEILGRLIFSTDMGDVSHVVPSIHPISCIYGIGTDAPNHTIQFAERAGGIEAQASTLLQGKALALTAIDIMKDPALLKNIQTEFHKTTM